SSAARGTVVVPRAHPRQVPMPVSRLRVRRLVAAALLAVCAALLPSEAAIAISPEHDAPDANAPIVSRGYDVSYPQCRGLLPAKPLFAIVGVNGGKAFSVNPCAAKEIAWAGGTEAWLYLNTGNPGPGASSFWPGNHLWPRYCDPANLDTADC